MTAAGIVVARRPAGNRFLTKELFRVVFAARHMQGFYFLAAVHISEGFDAKGVTIHLSMHKDAFLCVPWMCQARGVFLLFAAKLG
jgi:hypothetical protein